MKRFNTILGSFVPALFLWGGTSVARAGGDDTAFRALSLEGALAAARAEKKPVLVSVGADWCSACKELDLKSLSRGSVKKALRERFVAIQVDGEKGEGPAVVRRYHVVGFPTVLLLDAQGREIDRVFDTPDAGAFLRLLSEFVAGKGTLADLERQLAANPDNLALRFEVGSRLAIRGDRDRALIHLADVVMKDVRNRRGLASKSLVLMGKYLLLRGQNDPARAKDVLEMLVGYFGDTPEGREGVSALAIAYSRLGDEARAMRLLRTPIERAPQRGGGYNTLAWFYFREKKDVARAIEVAKEGLARAPADHALWDTLAEFEHAAKRPAQALAAARRAAALDPKDAYYAYQLRRFTKSAGGVSTSTTSP